MSHMATFYQAKETLTPKNLFFSTLIVYYRQSQIDAHQYATALDFEEVRLRRQLEVQQDIDFRRRLMEEQQNQLLSELEYRNQIQQLQELQELQAQHQQQQQQGLSQLLSQNPHLLELQQQQQSQSGRENSLLAYLCDDFLLQRHQQMLQDQMQQQLQERLSRESHQHEQEELLAMLQACGNLRGILPTEAASLISSLRHGEIVNQQQSSDQSSAQSNRPPAGHSPVLLENLINNSIKLRADTSSTHQDHTYGQTDVNSPKKRTFSDLSDINAGGGSPDTPKRVKKTKLAKNSPKVKLTPSNDRASDSLVGNQTTIDKDEELDTKVAKLLASQKIGAEKKKKKEKEKEKENEKVSPEKKGATRASNVEKSLARKEGKRKGGPVITQEGNKSSRKNGHGDVGIKLSGQEEIVVNFLCTGGEKNGKANVCVSNGVHHAGEKNNGEEAKMDTALYDDEAVDIVLNFQRCVVPDSEVQQAKKWSKDNQPPESIPFFSPVLKVDFPSLPIEPEVNDLEAACIITVDTPQLATEYAMDGKSESSLITSSPTLIGVNESKDVDDIKFIGTKKKVFKPKKDEKGQDAWWPSDECIRKERQKLGIKQDEEDTDEDDEAFVVSGISFVKAGIESMKRRCMTSVEPGVLEKLPHCKLYDDFCKDTKKKLFCCQTTEIFPFEHMVCCSVCGTWRHAQCGGHYKRFTSESVDPSNLLFEPVCDQCYLEKKFVESNPVASARLERQRIEHLRRCNATNAVMRQVAFAKHSGQYKWPLGCVSTSHISGHVRSVQSRHEKAEKQWSEMATRLGNGQELKPKERQRVRMRELERLLAHVEDAGKWIIIILACSRPCLCLSLFSPIRSYRPEGAMDRHNIMLFLQNDSSKLHPAGFELPRRNIFDPEEDPVNDSDQSGFAKSAKSLVNRISEVARVSQSGMGGLTATYTGAADKDGVTNSKICQVCARKGCGLRPRFDSIFCSDSCGVSTLEKDLLRSLQYAMKLHPSVLRL